MLTPPALRWSAPLLVALSLALLAAAGCMRPQSSTSSEEPAAATGPIEPFPGEYPIQAVATTGPVADMVRQLGGEHLEVAGLMGPGVDPHLYRAVPSDIERLSSADIVFYNGMHLEGRMADTLEQLAARKPSIAITSGLVEADDPRLRQPPEFEGYYDPHLWHDALLWANCADYVAEVLCEFDPDHRDDYLRNKEAFQSQLREVDEYCRSQLDTIPEAQRVLVSAHDAFGYFCQTYGLEPLPLGGISTDEEVSIGRMDDVVRLVVDRQVKAVFVETAVAPRIVKALVEPCRSLGHEVRVGGELYADALGPAGSGADTCAGMIRTNVDTIVSALR